MQRGKWGRDGEGLQEQVSRTHRVPLTRQLVCRRGQATVRLELTAPDGGGWTMTSELEGAWPRGWNTQQGSHYCRAKDLCSGESLTSSTVCTGQSPRPPGLSFPICDMTGGAPSQRPLLPALPSSLDAHLPPCPDSPVCQAQPWVTSSQPVHCPAPRPHALPQGPPLPPCQVGRSRVTIPIHR